ncbi:hypothetical protein B0J14DRAFT_498425 [Halenospora varia]|nr:hypothetical protein B0J14DRAFT_498425 [Halenospora varia]
MFFKSLAVVAAITGAAVAQRPSNTSICDYYTTALLKNLTAENEMTLLTLIVNTAVIGNYTKPNVGVKVAGILAPGMYNGTKVNLLPYFSGGLASTNTGGSVGQSVSFLDGGGAAPLMLNMPANDTTSNQYMLLTHLYEYFGALLGCTKMGNPAFPNYDGDSSMYRVHKFMDLSAAEVGYFIEQVAMSAASFGVATSDLMVVGTALNSLFGYRCAPETVVIPSQSAQLQAICIDDTCPISPNATCSSYAAVMKPGNATTSSKPSSTTTGSGASGSSSATATKSGSSTSGTSSPTTVSAGAATFGMSFAVIAGGLAALFL